MNLVDTIRKIVAPLQRRVMNMVARAVIQGIKDDGKIQKLQLTVMADEVLDGVDRIQEFGFSSTPPVGAQAVLLSLGGNRDHCVVIATEHGPARPQGIAAGESAVYSVGKFIVKVCNDKIQVGKDGVFETVVVGETLAELLGHLIDDLAAHTHGPPGTPPATAAAITARKTSYIANNKILAKDGGRF
jgi:phage gp45-like